MPDNLPRYTPEELPDHLFTKSELSKMRLLPIDVEKNEGWVFYPSYRREYKLFNIKNTKEPQKRKKYKNASWETPDKTVEEVLKGRCQRYKEYKRRKTQQVKSTLEERDENGKLIVKVIVEGETEMPVLKDDLKLKAVKMLLETMIHREDCNFYNQEELKGQLEEIHDFLTDLRSF